MNDQSSNILNTLRCYITVDFDCSYLPPRLARNLLVDPAVPLNPTLFDALLNHGFRRSGRHIYRPHCDGCQECVPVRVPSQQFRPNRSQLRCQRRNQDLSQTPASAEFNPEHFELYCRYLAQRHRGSSMNNPTEEDYLNFLTCPGIETLFHEFRLGKQLVAVAVTDYAPSGLSAIYSFFEPTLNQRSLGTYTIMWQLREALRRRLPYLFLGYWIKNCRKMAYKNQFQPLELFHHGLWQKPNHL